MSMEWMRGPYHKAYKTTLRVMVWCGVTSLWPPTTCKVCQTPSVCINWTCHEYEVDGMSQS